MGEWIGRPPDRSWVEYVLLQLFVPASARLGSPDTGTYLDRVIEDVTSKSPTFFLAMIDEDARLGDRGVVFLRFEHPKATTEFWVDLERGAIPLRSVIRDMDLNGSRGKMRKRTSTDANRWGRFT
jgi:hypothetical protein